MYSMEFIQSFHLLTMNRNPMLASTGLHSGMTIWKQMRISLAPSIFADSVNSFGRLR